MAKRGWSLTDAQLERRRQNPAARRSTRPDAATTRAKVTARSKALSRPSPARIAERGSASTGQASLPYNRTTYSQTDVSDLRGAKTGLVRSNESGPPAAAYVDRPEYRGGAHPTNFGLRGQQIGNPGGPVRSTRQSVPETPKQSGYRRQRSTQAAYRAADSAMDLADWDSSVAAGKRARRQQLRPDAYRAADASMFNSTVTPRAERAENKKARSRMSPDQNVFW